VEEEEEEEEEAMTDDARHELFDGFTKLVFGASLQVFTR
jgi:hypothetical protein